MLDDIATLAEECKKNDRDVSEIELSLYMAPPDIDSAKMHEDGGVRRFIFGLPPAPTETIIPLLDRYAEIISAVNG